MAIKRGEVYLVDFGWKSGSVQGGLRPAVIVQNDIGNLYSPTVTVLPITSICKKNGQPTHVLLRQGEGGLIKQSMILTEQICTIGKECLGRKLGIVTYGIQIDISRAIKIQLDI